MNNTLRKLLFASFAVLLTLGAASRAFAQSTGSIRGTVSDPSGAAIAKAAVTLTDTNTGINRDTVTNDSGIFVYPEMCIRDREWAWNPFVRGLCCRGCGLIETAVFAADREERNRARQRHEPDQTKYRRVGDAVDENAGEQRK